MAYLCYNRGVQLIGANRSRAVLSCGAGVRNRDGDACFSASARKLFHFIGFALVLIGRLTWRHENRPRQA